jgi:hypothetical protein
MLGGVIGRDIRVCAADYHIAVDIELSGRTRGTNAGIAGFIYKQSSGPTLRRSSSHNNISPGEVSIIVGIGKMAVI